MSTDNGTVTGPAYVRYEPQILLVLDLCDVDASTPVSYRYALELVAVDCGMTVDRLDGLVRIWCAIAGIEAGPFAPTGTEG